MLLPVHNGASTLDHCLTSIAGQTLAQYEIVLVDDGSTDSTALIATAYAKGDRRLRVLRLPHVGLVRALNYGLSQAKAPLIARMDADDWMAPARLAAQLEASRRWPECTVVGSRVRAWPESALTGGMREYLVWQNSCMSAQDMAADIFLESPLTHPSTLYNRAAVMAAGGYRHGPYPEDYELWLRLHALGHRFAKLQASLLHWRQSGGSLSRRDPRYSRDAFDRLRAHYLCSYLRRRGVRSLVIWGAGRKTRRRAAHLLRFGFTIEAWIDIDPRKVGNVINGARVVTPSWLRARYGRSAVLVYVATHGARQQIARYLEFIGLVRGSDFWLIG